MANFIIDAYAITEEDAEQLHTTKIAVVEDAFRKMRTEPLPQPTVKLYFVKYTPLFTPEEMERTPVIFSPSEVSFADAQKNAKPILEQFSTLENILLLTNEDKDAQSLLSEYKDAMRDVLLVPSEYAIRAAYNLSLSQLSALWEIKVQLSLQQGNPKPRE